MEPNGKQLRVIIYTRISKDKAGDAHGVANQLAECERYAAARGWQVTARLSDNDLSASNGKRRPAYDEVLRLVTARAADVILCWRIDRLVRRVIDLEAVITRFEAAGVKLAAVTGDLDLGTGPGRMVGRMLSVIAQGEVEAKAERQRLAAGQAARAGKRWTGCPRPFGYEADHVTPRAAEASAIRWAADCLLGGGTVSSVAREWGRRGLAGAQSGRPFAGPGERVPPGARQSVLTILRNPRLAGISVYDGAEVGRGDWEPVLPEETWRAVTALLADPGRKAPRGVRTLLGGLASCRCGNGVQGTRSYQGNAIYRCNPAIRDGREGPHAAARAAPADDYARAVITARLARPDLADLITPARPGTAALRTEAASIRRNLDELAADRALGLVSRAQMLAATGRGRARLDEIAAGLAASAGTSALAPFTAGRPARDVWESLDLARQRAVITTLADVTLHPAGRGRKVFDPATVVIAWRQS